MNHRNIMALPGYLNQLNADIAKTECSIDFTTIAILAMAYTLATRTKAFNIDVATLLLKAQHYAQNVNGIQSKLTGELKAGTARILKTMIPSMI